MENISIDYNPLPPPPTPTYTQAQKDTAANEVARARSYATSMNYFASIYAGKLDPWRSGVLATGALLENAYADWLERAVVKDPPETDCSAWNFQPMGMNYTGDPQLDAVIRQASYYLGEFETAYHSSNRYMGGCGDWQRDAAYSALRNAGLYMQYNGFAWVAIGLPHLLHRRFDSACSFSPPLIESCWR
jgi:hypothetical protein